MLKILVSCARETEKQTNNNCLCCCRCSIHNVYNNDADDADDDGQKNVNFFVICRIQMLYAVWGISTEKKIYAYFEFYTEIKRSNMSNLQTVLSGC